MHTPEASAQLPADSPKHKPRSRWFIALGTISAALVVLFVAGYWWLNATATVQNTGVEQCRDTPVESALDNPAVDEIHLDICATLEKLPDAWAAHDAEAYGEAFTEDATYTTFAGTHYTGREDIIGSHKALFEGPLEGTQLVDRYLSLRFVSDGVAIMTTRGDTYEREVPDELTKVQTYTLTQEGDQWLVAAFHNTQRSPVMEQVQYLWMPETIPAAER
jgi:uncharacterized protein (TIGR02246 family)